MISLLIFLRRFALKGVALHCEAVVASLNPTPQRLVQQGSAAQQRNQIDRGRGQAEWPYVISYIKPTRMAYIFVPAIIDVPWALWAHGDESIVPCGAMGPMGPGGQTAGGRAEHRNVNRNNNIGQWSI